MGGRSRGHGIGGHGIGGHGIRGHGIGGHGIGGHGIGGRSNFGRSRGHSGPSPYALALMSRPQTDQTKIIFPAGHDGMFSLEEFNPNQVQGHIDPEEVKKVIIGLNNLEGVKFSDYNPNMTYLLILMVCFMIFHVFVFPCLFYVMMQGGKAFGERYKRFNEYLTGPDVKGKFESAEMSWMVGA